MSGKHISELQNGDQIIGWQKNGFALYVERDKYGEAYLVCPTKPKVIDSSSISNYEGYVVSNDTASKVLRVHIQLHSGLFSYGDSYTAEIPYASIRVLRLLSPYANILPPDALYRPTLDRGLRPSRTYVDVRLV